ncbi:hypothetical protein [Chitinophaga alhagiae]|uniref:hypothetical protein n=1 Tax=Chitinophaga alhagiae TaxID=2203219 RepID=UPI0013007EB0|nr:hypothetical protein [Chitinophaga alhagiae]
MKLLSYLFVAVLFVSARVSAQNVFPTPSGNVGIGTATPASKLHVLDNGRNYYVNRGIPGQTEDAQGANYLLLHKIYTGTLLAEHFVMGKITAIRGGISALNRKWTVEVNTSAAYSQNHGSMISYNEPARLVTLTYSGQAYLAVEIVSSPTLASFSFTGYANNESLQLVFDQNVSNVQLFQPTDPIGIQGRLGIGVRDPATMLHVHGQQNTNIAKFTFGSIPAAEAYLDVSNGTIIGGSYLPLIRGRSYTPGRPLGIYLIGEAEDVVAAGPEVHHAAIVLDGRAKTNTKLNNNNVLAVNSNAQNLMLLKADGSLGIGTTNTFGHKLAVNGSAIFTKVKVKAYAGWPDYVFQPGYLLPSLQEVEQYIQIHRHLPGIPAEQEVKEQGIDLGEMDKKLLQKIEELMLYTIAQQKQIDTLLQMNRQLQREVTQIKQASQK